MGMLPMSVEGGDFAEGNWLAMAGLCGPGSVMLAGFSALIAPCGGWPAPSSRSSTLQQLMLLTVHVAIACHYSLRWPATVDTLHRPVADALKWLHPRQSR
jgi:hypothetical protein